MEIVEAGLIRNGKVVMTITTVKSSELRDGDVVLTHGMRVKLDRPVATQLGANGLVFTWDGLVLNQAEVLAEGFITRGFIPDGRWTVQGNDLATWAVER